MICLLLEVVNNHGNEGTVFLDTYRTVGIASDKPPKRVSVKQ